MRTGKKLTALLLAAVMLFSMTVLVTGCGSEKSQNNGDKTHVVLNEVAHSIFYAPMYVAIEEGYFAEEGLDVELVTGYGADKTMTALLSGEADIGFMGAEATIYSYAEGMEDSAVNFAQLTQRAGNFLVAREPIEDFSWDMLKGKDVLGGRAGGMPEMVFEYILSKNNIDKSEVNIDQSIDFGSTAAAFSGGQGEFTVVRDILLHQISGRKSGGKFRSLFLILKVLLYVFQSHIIKIARRQDNYRLFRFSCKTPPEYYCTRRCRPPLSSASSAARWYPSGPMGRTGHLHPVGGLESHCTGAATTSPDAPWIRQYISSRTSSP